MARKKLVRFQEVAERPNVIDPGVNGDENVQGTWHTEYFKNDHPIVVELACGRGEYTVGLAAVFPEKNFIGVDVKGDRIWMGSSFALENNLDNVAFVRSQIQRLDRIFNPQEVDEIWITFPDPRPRERDKRRRLTSPRYLELYKHIIAREGTIHLKTDSEELFDYTLQVLEKLNVRDLISTHNLYQSPLYDLHHGIKTRFEQIFTDKGCNVHYLQFKF